MRKTIITVAPTGEGPTKAMNPATPITPREIAESVYESYNAGASIAHIHVRDDNGNPTMSLDKFMETVHLIREKCNIVINLTSSGDINAGDDERINHIIKIRPEMASFDAGTMNWMNEDIFQNHPKFLHKLGLAMIENDVKPEIEVFDVGMIYNALHYMKIGVLKPPIHFQFVLGVAGGIPASVENLIFLVNKLPEGSTWSAFGVGKHHLEILTASLVLGGSVRVGFEDNIYYKKGVLAESNAQLVSRAVRIAQEQNLEIASPDDVRNMFNLKKNYFAK